MDFNFIDSFVDVLKTWAAKQPDILAIAMIGSHARGTARPDSDLDIIVIVEDPAPYLKTSAWLERFGHVRSVSHENWGLMQSRRVCYANGAEVEFGITVRSWASVDPVDPGTQKVVSNGIHILYDPKITLQTLLAKLKQTGISS